MSLRAGKHRHTKAPSLVGEFTVHCLTNENREEVLEFLNARPCHTVCMSGLIHDNGMESEFNRGMFFACRDREGELLGVALIGHAVLVEVRCEEALYAFARRATTFPGIRLIRGEQELVEQFWRHYSRDGAIASRVCRELLMEQCWPIPAVEPVPGLRIATLQDLPLITEINSEMAFAESGINPAEYDPEGFHRRCARRIEQGRYFVWTEDGKVIFKADVISQTPRALYLEGIYVNPAFRGSGYSLRCLGQLGQNLLSRNRSLCLTVNQENHRAIAFYKKSGYRQRSYYDTIYLQPANA